MALRRIDLSARARYPIYMEERTAQEKEQASSACSLLQNKSLSVKQDTAPPINIPLYENTHSQTLAQALWLSGKLSPRPLCSGLGRCGVCKVRFLAHAPVSLEIEEKVLGADAVKQGWRLACRHEVHHLFTHADTIELVLPPKKLASPCSTETQTPQAPAVSICSSASLQEVTLAVDLGTTSLHWRCIDAKGETLCQSSMLNPQMGAGADVISRLSYGMTTQGREVLASLVSQSLGDIIQGLPAAYTVREICLAANTAMTALFLQKDCSSLAHAPYALPVQGHSVEQVQGLPPIYIPPQLAPFVGGDISAGYAALLAQGRLAQENAFPFLLADLGTNGEFILALHPEKAFIASVPMGPALEGIGLRHGHMVDASPGIVHAVHLGAAGLLPKTVDGDAPQKICGTGYISLLHALLKVGILTTQGFFATDTQTQRSPFYKKIISHLQMQGDERLLHLWPERAASPMILSAVDVEEIIKVKATFSLAMSYLLHHAGLAPSALKHIYLAGAMGSHIQTDDLEGLGFVPQGAGARVVPLGNAALEGATYLLQDVSLRQHLHQWSKACTLVKLTEDEHFTEKFMQHMNFSYAG